MYARTGAGPITPIAAMATNPARRPRTRRARAGSARGHPRRQQRSAVPAPRSSRRVSRPGSLLPRPLKPRVRRLSLEPPRLWRPRCAAGAPGARPSGRASAPQSLARWSWRRTLVRHRPEELVDGRRLRLADQPALAHGCGDIGVGGRRAQRLPQSAHDRVGDVLVVRARELAGGRDDARLGIALRRRRRSDVAAALVRFPEQLGCFEIRVDDGRLLSRELIQDPERDRRARQPLDLGRRIAQAVALQLLGEPVARCGELLRRGREQRIDPILDALDPIARRDGRIVVIHGPMLGPVILAVCGLASPACPLARAADAMAPRSAFSAAT